VNAEPQGRRREVTRLLGACAGLLALSAAVGSAVNTVRPGSSRLPWVGDWDRHIETLAFRAGIPVTFLMGVRDRLRDPHLVLFDARTPDEYAAGHLPGALSLPIRDVDARIIDYIDRARMDSPILIYCEGLECEDGLALALKLREFGFEDLTLYPGGYEEWIAYGGVVTQGPAP